MPTGSSADLTPVVRSLRQAYEVIPHVRFWSIAVLSVLAGVAIGLPFVYLFSRDQSGVAGFLLDSFWLLFMPSLLVLAAVSELSDARRNPCGERLRASFKKHPGALFLLLIATLFLYGYVHDVSFHLQLRRLNAVSSVQVGCREIFDPNDVERIAAAVRDARWFSPMSHGWSHDIPFTVKLESGHELHYFLSRYLSKDSAIIVSPAANPDRASSAELAAILTQTGSWQATPRWSDYSHSYHNEMTATSEGTCQPAQHR